MLTPFTTREADVPYWRNAVGCKVIAGPTLFVVVAMPGPVPKILRLRDVVKTQRRITKNRPLDDGTPRRERGYRAFVEWRKGGRTMVRMSPLFEAEGAAQDWTPDELNEVVSGMKKPTFKPCAGCPYPAKCKAAGKCAKKAK